MGSKNNNSLSPSDFILNEITNEITIPQTNEITIPQTNVNLNKCYKKI